MLFVHVFEFINNFLCVVTLSVASGERQDESAQTPERSERTGLPSGEEEDQAGEHKERRDRGWQSKAHTGAHLDTHPPFPGQRGAYQKHWYSSSDSGRERETNKDNDLQHFNVYKTSLMA